MRSIAMISIFFGLMAAPAQAAHLGKIIVDEADVREFPQEKAKAIATLKKDEEIAVSNLPTEGFYKVRLKSGELGWISGNDIYVDRPGATEGSYKASTKKASRDDDEKIHFKEDEEEAANHGWKRPHSRVLIGLGIQNPIYDGLGTYLVTTGINPGYGAELEMQFHWFSSVYWALRAEYTFTKTATLTLPTGETQTIKHVGVPLEAGIVWSPVESKDFRFGIGIYGGVVMANSTNVSQSNASQILTVNYGSTDPCVTLTGQIGYGLGPTSSLFFEAGYRSEKTGLLPTTALLNPATIPEFAIDYSGPLARFGIEFRF